MRDKTSLKSPLDVGRHRAGVGQVFLVRLPCVTTLKRLDSYSLLFYLGNFREDYIEI